MKDGRRIFLAMRKTPLAILEREEQRDLLRLSSFDRDLSQAKPQIGGRVIRLSPAQGKLLRQMSRTKITF
jgi:hypothetical protein